MSPMTYAVTKTMDCSLKTERWIPLLETTLIQLTEHGVVELLASWSIQLYVLVPLMQEDTL